MRNGMFVRLAIDNMKKNKGTYIPYMITCIGCIAMLYLMLFINVNPGIEKMHGGRDAQAIISLGIVVVGIFSCIFLLYSNSFLMKRRQKEIGLYNILGMEKGHISKMMLLETIFSSVISLFFGCLLGVLGSKLALLLFLKLIHIPAQFGFYICWEGIGICVCAFGGIFLLTLFFNLRRVHLSKPIELLRGSNVGEREPKAKWLMALIGFACLGGGYYIAITTESPLETLGYFFIAVLLVMAGTYLVFTAGSIAILKILRWKKSFYYKMKNFTSVSGMIYRMKQNAMGLASICILSTGVLLMLSSTVSLNFGIENIVQNRYPNDVNIGIRYVTLKEARSVIPFIENALKKEQIPYKNYEHSILMDIACSLEDGELVFRNPGETLVDSVGVLSVISEDSYEKLVGEKVELENGQVISYGQTSGETLRIQGVDFQVKEWMKEWPLNSSYSVYGEIRAVVVTDEDYNRIDQMQREAYDVPSTTNLEIGIDLEGTVDRERAVDCRTRMEKYLTELKDSGMISQESWILNETRMENYEVFYSLNGGLLFLGILLGGMFLMGTAMIIYYKQMSEGYEDKGRFEIMRKVGMSRREVKSSIRRQILMVFFLPLLMAVLHISMAFPMVKRLLLLLGMTNTKLYVICTVVTILVFAVVYGGIYLVTARSYYKILEKAE